MKALYETPQMELMKFKTEDVISTSGEQGSFASGEDEENMGPIH